MSKPLLQYLTPELRRLIYLILTCVSLTLLFYSAWQVKPVGIEVNAPLGLASYLAPAHWIGQTILMITSILAFLDRQLKKDTIFIIILVALGLFLLGIRVLVEPNALDPDSYYPTSEVNNLLAQGHLDIGGTASLVSYYSWPAIHFISAYLLDVTGADLITLIKFTPLFWIVCFVFITYGIGMRLKLQPGSCFLLSFLAVSSWMVNYAGFYYARFPATVFFLLLLMIFVEPRRGAASTLISLLVFGALVITHGLTAVAVLPGMILLSFYRRDFVFAAVVVVIFGAWYLYQGTTALEAGIQAFATPLRDIFEITKTERYQVSASAARLVSRYSELGYLALYVTLAIGSAVLLVTRRTTGERRNQVIALTIWTIGVALVIFWGHGQVAFRTFIYSVVPTASIIVLSFSSRKLLIPAMCLFVALSPLANYAGLAAWGRVTTPELKGAEFFALEIRPKDSYFYSYTPALILYYDSSWLAVPSFNPAYYVTQPSDVDLSVLDGLRYVIISKLQTDWQEFSWSEAPYSDWPNTKVGRMANLIYNNEYFQTYENLTTD